MPNIIIQHEYITCGDMVIQEFNTESKSNGITLMPR